VIALGNSVEEVKTQLQDRLKQIEGVFLVKYDEAVEVLEEKIEEGKKQGITF